MPAAFRLYAPVAALQNSLDGAPGANATPSSRHPTTSEDSDGLANLRPRLHDLDMSRTGTNWVAFTIPMVYGVLLMMIALLLALVSRQRAPSADEHDTTMSLAKEDAANVALGGVAPAPTPALKALPGASTRVPANPREAGKGAMGGDCTAAFDPLRNLRDMCFRKPSTANQARFEALDGLRAAAFLWVVAHHAAIHHVALDREWRPQFLSNLIEWGDSGVTLFLVLSGFLLTHVMMAELEQSGGTCAEAYCRFHFRRFARVYPALLSSVIVVQCTVSAILGYSFFSACDQPLEKLPVFEFIELSGLWQPLLKHSLLVANYDKLNRCPATAAPWTVSFEAQCYLLFPAVTAFYSSAFTPPWPLTMAATAVPWRKWCPPATGDLLWLLAPVIALSLVAYSMAFRSSFSETDTRRTVFPYLLCEYAAGTIAYFMAGHRLLDWVRSATALSAGGDHHLVSRRSTVDAQLHLALQGLW